MKFRHTLSGLFSNSEVGSKKIVFDTIQTHSFSEWRLHLNVISLNHKTLVTNKVDKVNKLSKFEGWKWLSKPISHHVICRDIIEVNKNHWFNFSYVVMMNINMLCTGMKFWVLSQWYDSLIVHTDCHWVKPLKF